MQASYLPLFFDRESGEGLEFAGRRDGEELVEGTLRAKGREVAEIVDGVARFSEYDNWPEEALARTMTDDWLTRKWRAKVAEADPTEARFCEELAAVDGVILEIATGPGGGNLQGILHRNPRARVIANDTSHRLLVRWRRFLLKTKLAESVCFAAFDARKMVLKDASVAAVSGVSAFDNIGGVEAFREAFRLLAPGGALYSWDMVVDPEDWARLPAEFREEEEAHAPGFTRGIAGPLCEAGFRIEYEESIPGRALTAGEDAIQKRADQYGVTLHVRFGHTKARKSV